MKSKIPFIFYCLFFSIIFSACSTLENKQRTPVSSSSSSFGARYYQPLFLDNISRHQERLDQFLKRHTRFTEQDKIDYLLSSTRISGAKFVRNGNQYDGSSAAKFLRWKMLHKQYRNSPIRTADDFVNRVAVRSNKTGRPYEIILPDGRREKTVDVFRSELEALEKALLKNQSLQILPHNSQVKQSNHAGTIVHVAAFKSK